MKQKDLIISYIREHGSILPAKLYGELYLGTMFGSELSKRARELRAKGILRSEPDGKFERYFMAEISPREMNETVARINAIPAFKEKIKKEETPNLFP